MLYHILTGRCGLSRALFMASVAKAVDAKRSWIRMANPSNSLQPESCSGGEEPSGGMNVDNEQELETFSHFSEKLKQA